MFSAFLVCCLSVAPVQDKPGTQPKADPIVAPVKEGYYRCVSALPGGKQAVSIVSVRKARDVYIVIQVQKDGSSIAGVGFVKESNLVIGWAAGEARGVTVYNIEAKQLRGEYTVLPGDGRKYSEVCTFLTDFGSEDEPKKE